MPDGKMIVCLSDCDTKDTHKDWRYCNPRGGTSLESGLFRPCHRGHWGWDSAIVSWSQCLNLENTPAKDVFRALPECVQKVVQP